MRINPRRRRRIIPLLLLVFLLRQLHAPTVLVTSISRGDGRRDSSEMYNDDDDAVLEEEEEGEDEDEDYYSDEIDEGEDMDEDYYDNEYDEDMEDEEEADENYYAPESDDYYLEDEELYDDGFTTNVLGMGEDDGHHYGGRGAGGDAVISNDKLPPVDKTNERFIVAKATTPKPKSTKEKSSSNCGVYYAESTIPGAGFGIFAGRNFKKGDSVTPGDLAVPTIDMPWHYGYKDDYEYNFLWNEYNWDTSGFPFMEDEGKSVSASSFGIGALPNCFFPLINVEDTKTLIDTAGLHRSRDAGSGAFTPYHNRQGHALVDIPAGMELFVDYGESYFDTRTEQFGPIPLPQHYHMSNKFIRRYADFIHFVLARWHDVCMHRGFCSHFDVHSSLFSVIHDIKEIWGSRILYALPTDPSRLEETLERGTDNTFYNRSIRDLEWLEEHGTCMDNLYAGPSTIRQAGRGAFARQSIQKGEIVAPVPLLHISDKDMFIMYEAKSGRHPQSKFHVRNKDAPIHQQLLLNYCFGHPDLSILLCPYGITGSLVNHSKERANAKVVWSTKSMRKPEWLEQPPSAWAETLVSGLAFDFVATKDIAAGDEVFISYGDDWEHAWKEHVKRFSKTPGRSPFYTPAYELDEQVDSIIKTMAEGSYDSKEVQLKCHEEYRLLRGLWPDEADMTKHPCRAVHRYVTDSGEYLYWVEILEREDHEWDVNRQCYEHTAEIMFDVPRDAFTFSDAFGARDHGQTWSFRHHIGIPNDIIPAAWLEKKQRFHIVV